MGSDPMALPLLDFLKKGPSGVELVGLFTQPDRKHGRGQQVQPNEIKRWAVEHRVPVLQPLAKPGQDEIQWLQDNCVDLIIVFAYGHLLTQAFLDAVPLGVLNVHTSLLPAYRGAAPIETAVALGERETGLSLMRLVKAMDAGPLLKQTHLPIGPEDTGGTLRERIAAAAVPLVGEALGPVFEKTAVFHEQDHSLATYTRALSTADGLLDLRAPAKVLAARIRGLYPWPGGRLETQNGQVLKLGMAQALDAVGDGMPPGTVVRSDATGVYVVTGQGLLRLDALQRPGGRMLPAGSFLLGFDLKPGDCFKSQPMTQLLRD